MADQFGDRLYQRACARVDVYLTEKGQDACVSILRPTLGQRLDEFVQAQEARGCAVTVGADTVVVTKK